ncbi:choice-of-anchor J domain-containing protein [Flavobacteriaceae bacterium MJ-SS4]|uniref:choice-of-anchor J domain-containing protein n=1 Tax=Gilvirhabdus luticola TaxID=3079858 RepID=UPI0032DDC313
MKKIILFSFIIGIAYNINSQCDHTLPVYEDFSNTFAVNSCWTYIDDDGDGLGWSITSLDGSGNKGLKSKSFAGTALTPDNWIISPSIDLPSSGIIDLTWKVRATYWQYDAENYSVYVATGNSQSDFTSSPVMFTENLVGSDASGSFANRSLNISSLAGQTVYIAFRHHDVSDQFEIDIDDFYITSSVLGIDDLESISFKHYYNINTKELTLKSSNMRMDKISLFNIIGQNVLNKTLSQTEEKIDLSTLRKGIYIGQVSFDNVVKTIKFVKQ